MKDILIQLIETNTWMVWPYLLLQVIMWAGIAVLVVYPLKMFLQGHFDIKRKQLEQSDAARLLSHFDNKSIGEAGYEDLRRLINVISDGHYIYRADIQNAIKKLKDEK